jgi:hypothetical protein
MRLLATLLLISAVVVSAASAEFLLTANPLGQGKWGLLGGYVSDANYGNMSGSSLGTIGGYAGYGITDKLDVLVQLGSSTYSGALPLGVSGVTGTGYAVNLKYALMAEGKDLPVSVAVGGGYKSASQVASIVGGGSASTPLSQISLAAGVSKVMAPFVPYGAVAYRSMNSSGTAMGTAIDLTVGTAIAWSMQGAVMVEYTMQSITPNGGSNYSSGQMAAGVAYML